MEMKERQRYIESERGERERAPFLCESLGKINPVRGGKKTFCAITLWHPHPEMMQPSSVTLKCQINVCKRWKSCPSRCVLSLPVSSF